MFTKHGINETARVEQPMHLASRVDVRCLCGSLLITGPLIMMIPANIELAYDKHLLNILEYTWVKQFYQEAS
jgi:hypothetical protein